ncbi:glycosyltransferase family 2 protein [Coleofasciculus sp. E1-EBD-02]|uniref:glycosyltransferase family 2 protein n=1 Tax=Coleofasciculus sp. E1-EBD-02 TaxID=3068481 RepID=UPI0032FCBCB2
MSQSNKIVKTSLYLPFQGEPRQEGGLRTQGLFKQASKNQALISIITVVLDGGKYIEQTIKSVISQSYKNIEYIVIDGGSQDNTLDIIKKYDHQIDYWISEADKGIYDAMNRGIGLATGELVGILNSDDWYVQNAIDKVIDIYTKNRSNDLLIITGAMYRVNVEQKIKFKLLKNEADLKNRINLGMPINHPATFVTKATYQKIGKFDPKYRVCGDYEFIVRAYYSNEVRFIFTNDVLTYMRLDGMSEKFNILFIRAKEQFYIRRDKIPIISNFKLFCKFILIQIFKHLLKTFTGKFLLKKYYKCRHHE